MPDLLCHVVDGVLPASGQLHGDPFLHCCTEAQLRFVLARHFPGRTGLHIVRFDPADIEGRIEWVRSEPDQDPFPHLYGTITFSNATIGTRFDCP